MDILIAMKHIIFSYEKIVKSIMQWINENQIEDQSLITF